MTKTDCPSTKKQVVTVALGCNQGGEEQLRQAMHLLADILTDIVSTRPLATDPIGMTGPKFLNMLAKGSTTLPPEALSARLKHIEQRLGDCRELRRQGIVRMDIDLLTHGQDAYHEADWQRPYIKQLMSELTQPHKA